MRKYDPSFHCDFNHCLARRDIEEALLKNRSNKKNADSRESYEITDTCSPDFNFWREFCDTSVLSSHTWIKT